MPLLGAVDTAVLGHLEEIHYLGALAVGGIIFNFVYWGFGFLRMGTTGLTAQAYGKNNDREIFLILLRTLMIALFAGFMLIILQKAIATISFRILHATPEVEKYAQEYFYIRIYAAPATLALYAFHGWFLGLQNAKYPLILTVVANVLNVILNLIFVFGLDMKSDGVAYGTVIAQYCGLLLAIWIFFRKFSSYIFAPSKKVVMASKSLKRIFVVNSDIFIRTLALIFTFSYFTAKSAESGTAILAANTILLQLINLLAYGVDGFAFASESLVGKYIGAGNIKNLKKAINLFFLWGLGLGLAFTIGFALFQEPILRFFTNKEDIIAVCRSYMLWVIIAPLTNSFCFIWDGIYLGATASGPMRNSMVFCTFLIFLPIYWLLRDSIGNHSLWLALTIFMIMRGATLTFYSRKYIYKFTA